jgi:hypothetical protein
VLELQANAAGMLTEGFVWRQKEREVVFRPRVQNGFGAKSDYSGKAYPVAISFAPVLVNSSAGADR